jgi:hypothetical protein
MGGANRVLSLTRSSTAAIRGNIPAGNVRLANGGPTLSDIGNDKSVLCATIRSRPGLIAVTIAVAGLAFSTVAMPILPGFLRATSFGSYFYYLYENLVPLINGAIFLGAILGIGLGIGGLYHPDRRRDLPILGIVLNGILLLGQLAEWYAHYHLAFRRGVG